MSGYTLASYLEAINQKKISADDVVNDYLFRAKEKNPTLNAFVRFHDDYVAQNKETLYDRPFAGAPIGIKDIFMTAGYETTCASKILQGYIPPHSATSFEKCVDAGLLMIGKTNMDEFAMGSSGETSAYGPTYNPLDTTKTPGGSSSGSAAAVAGDLCIAALGTDTGGSCRQPAAMCGIVGAKPTYGSISRYGVQSMANSFDQVGTLTKTVEDAVLLINTMIGQDDRDMTSVQREKIQFLDRPLSSFRLAVPDIVDDAGVSESVKILFEQSCAILRAKGVQIDRVSVPLLRDAIAVYYVLCPAEVMGNMARFDGIKYGLQTDSFAYENLYEYITAVREEGFGDEVKRRILTGASVLRSENFDLYYRNACAMQTDLNMQLTNIFTDYDAFLTPTSPEFPWTIGEKQDDPARLYMADLFTIPANLCQMPGVAFPMRSLTDRVFPLSLHLMAPKWGENAMMTIARYCEQLGMM